MIEFPQCELDTENTTSDPGCALRSQSAHGPHLLVELSSGAHPPTRGDTGAGEPEAVLAGEFVQEQPAAGTIAPVGFTIDELEPRLCPGRCSHNVGNLNAAPERCVAGATLDEAMQRRRVVREVEDATPLHERAYGQHVDKLIGLTVGTLDKRNSDQIL